MNRRDAARHGIRTSFQRMDNGELRFRLMDEEGCGYIRTVMGPIGSWQNAHVHRRTLETYIVQSGWIALAQLRDGDLELRIHSEGALLTIEPEMPHNVYLSARTVIHTVKHGQCHPDDWQTSPDLDQLSKEYSEPDLLRLAQQ